MNTPKIGQRWIFKQPTGYCITVEILDLLKDLSKIRIITSSSTYYPKGDIYSWEIPGKYNFLYWSCLPNQDRIAE